MALAPGIAFRIAEAPRLILPVFVGYATATAGVPTMPAHIADDLAYGTCQRGGSATLPVPTAPFTTWGTQYSGNTSAIAVGTADLTGSSVWNAWTNETGRRSCHVFRNAKRGIHAGFNNASGTSFTWPALAILPNSFVIASLFCTTAQTSMNGHEPSQLTVQRVSSTATPSVRIYDTGDGAGLIDSFTPGSAHTLDTATVNNGIVASIEGL